MAYNTTLDTPTEPKVPRNSLLLLLHLERTFATIYARLEVFKHAKAKQITVDTVYYNAQYQVVYLDRLLSRKAPLREAACN